MVTMKELKARHPDLESFRFGDGPEMCAELIALVRSGAKRATCGALRDFEAGEPMPKVGRRDVALNWDGSPALMIETVEVTQRRFCDVNADFALAEGENETLEGWQADHRRYFERNGGWAPEMMLVCERFRLVEDFA
ncbi:ASCH domain-containing protein [Limimaricola litoreus]|uniref:ASCH domain-containing protein n=1 Tax=Limimaricola litoreus TaxID=2955316 RepID=A0A9X2FT24_9RHOB|nr:ASCH domain-containing protein [Limimaricola litoreus]MCP1170180.1 ASCH domain-containing protein [Limimaricola litoreus]